MGGDCGSWFPQQQFNWQSPNLNYLGAPLHVGQKDTIPSLMNPGSDMISANGTLTHLLPDAPHSLVGQANEPCSWFYCLPQFQQAFIPALNSVLKEKLPSAPYNNHKEATIPKSEAGCAQKRFLVFDQSGDQTTLIFSSGIGTSVQCFTSWSTKPTVAYNLNGEGPGTKENLDLNLGPMSTDVFDEKNGTDLQSEMHEDTEELNALLYSDDDSDYTEDDEVASTGHSPSTMTAHYKQDWLEGSTEEVASSDGLNNKRKMFDWVGSDAPSLMDTASSVKSIRGFEYEDDAESRCANGMNSVSVGMGSELCNKRMRKERIRETVSILQDLIPGGKGKDAIVVLDEAIHYLKSLKHKVKDLGLDAP